MKKPLLLALVCALTAIAVTTTSCKKEDEKKYRITLTNDGNGTATTNHDTALPGTTVTLLATPNPGRTFYRWTVSSGNAEMSDPMAVRTTFTMPKGPVEIKAEFGLATDSDPGVTINGITWATRNLDAPGTFAALPEAFGMYYQYGRDTGWSATDPLTSSPVGTPWSGEGYSSEMWPDFADPCPDGWAVPNRSEFTLLAQATHTWTTQNGVPGRLFTSSTGDLFLPAMGYRSGAAGALSFVNETGYYWTITQESFRLCMGVLFNETDLRIFTIETAYAFPVRCMKLRE